jgi:hypothetical protein
MSLLEKLPQWFETKPLVLLRFEEGYESALQGTQHGLERFTVSGKRGAVVQWCSWRLASSWRWTPVYRKRR